jgi:outer membrane biosynthesis protein TonB
VKREEIVRGDFPVARKGYEQAAVDAHLRSVADSVERDAESESLASVAAERVRSIVEAAEAKAHEIEADARTGLDAAEKKAREIEADARREADELLSKAKAQAQEQVERAQGSVSKLIGQADELRERIGTMAQDVIATAGTASETPGPEIVPEPSPEPVPEPTPDPVPEPTPPEPEIDPSPVTVPEPEPPSIPEPQPDAPAPAAANGMSDDQAARLVAMKMALDGSSRDDVATHLASQYELANSDSLLDSVFARVGK